MKILLLNLKSFFNSNKILAVAFCVLTLTCITGGLFGTNYFFCNLEFYNEYLTTQKLYTFANTRQDSLSAVNAYLNEYGQITEHAIAKLNAEITCESVENNQNNQNSQSNLNGEQQTNFKIEAIISLSDNYKNAMYCAYGSMFTVEQINEGVNKIVLSQSSFGTEYIGKTVKLLGKEYEVIGLSAGQNFISYFSLSDKSVVQTIEITLKKPFLTANQKQEFKTELTTVFNGFIVNAPKDEDTSYIFNYLPMLLPTVFLVLFGFISLNFLYSYFVKMRKKQYAIFRLSGASISKISTLFFGETLTIFTVAFAVSFVIFKVITAIFFNTPPSFSNAYLIGITVFDAFNLKRTVTVYLVMIALLMVSFAPTFFKSVKKDIKI